MNLPYRTQGRDLDTVVTDITATEGIVVDPDKFHAACITYPTGVKEVKLRSDDPTPEQGIRTITIAHENDGLQRLLSIYDPVRGRYMVFYVQDKTILTLALIRYRGESFYYRIKYDSIK